MSLKTRRIVGKTQAKKKKISAFRKEVTAMPGKREELPVWERLFGGVEEGIKKE